MDAERRRQLNMAAEVDRAVSQITGSIQSIAAEGQWTAEQRLALRMVAGRIGSRTFGDFQRQQAEREKIEAAEKCIRQLATRIATLRPNQGSPTTLVLDPHIVAAARLLVASGKD